MVLRFTGRQTGKDTYRIEVENRPKFGHFEY
jgi:hypothetical protein